MLKLFGCVLIVAGSVGCGLCYLRTLFRRTSGLMTLVELLELFQIRLSYEYSTLPHLFESIEDPDKRFAPLTEYCLQALQQGMNLKDAWQKGAESYADTYCLKPEDLSALKAFSQCLGETDLEGQLANIALYREIFQKKATEAEQFCRDQRKLTLSCSLFGGLLLSILLI